MGNCLKKNTLFGESYLFEPLTTDNSVDFNNEISLEDYVKKEEIYIVENKINELAKKLSLLEQNTRKNLELLSSDIYYINDKQNTNLELHSESLYNSVTNETNETNKNKSYIASFINDENDNITQS